MSNVYNNNILYLFIGFFSFPLHPSTPTTRTVSRKQGNVNTGPNHMFFDIKSKCCHRPHVRAVVRAFTRRRTENRPRPTYRVVRLSGRRAVRRLENRSTAVARNARTGPDTRTVKIHNVGQPTAPLLSRWSPTDTMMMMMMIIESS